MEAAVLYRELALTPRSRSSCYQGAHGIEDCPNLAPVNIDVGVYDRHHVFATRVRSSVGSTKYSLSVVVDAETV